MINKLRKRICKKVMHINVSIMKESIFLYFKIFISPRFCLAKWIKIMDSEAS